MARHAEGMTENPYGRSIPVSALVGDEVVTVAPGTTIHDLARVLTEAEVGAVAVGDGRGVRAIVSERDIVHAVAEGRDLDATTALDIGSTSLIWSDAEATAAEVAFEMSEHYVRHVLVERDGRFLGIVSARDLLGVYAAEDEADID
jgi:CBS domain-containing protein